MTSGDDDLSDFGDWELDIGDGDWHWGIGDGWYRGEVGGGGEGSGVQMALGWGWSTLELYGVDMAMVYWE